MTEVAPKKKAKQVRAASKKSPAKSAAPRPAAPVLETPSRFFGPNWLIALLFSWGLILLGLFNLPNYRMLLSPDFPLPNLPVRWLLALGFIGLVALFKLAPRVAENEWDISPWTAKVWFVLFMVLAAWLRLKNAAEPVSGFWDDHYVVTRDIRNIVDFYWRPLLMPSGWREPFFPYLTALLWLVLPNATGVTIVHVSSAVIDLMALWALYLAAKEVGGRRMGLLVLGMGAICKALIEPCFFGYGNNTTVLGCALAMLFSLRVLKKPDWKHFLYWGLSLGFGAYCYVPFRVWIPVLLGCLWLWVYSDPKERGKDPFRLVLGIGGMTALALLFAIKNSFLSSESPLVKFLTSLPVLILVVAGLIFAYVKVAKQGLKGDGFKLFGWATGAIFTVLTMLPLFFHPNYSSHVADLSVFSKTFSPKPGDGLHHLMDNIIICLGLMFGQTGEVAQCPGIGDSFYDFFLAASGALALAYFVARPSWLKGFLLLLWVNSLTPFLLSNAPHSFRMVGADAPLLFIGAWGLNRLWLAFVQVGSRKVGEWPAGSCSY